MMAEQEYIDIQELTTIRCVRRVLSDICPEISSVITKEELLTLCEILHGWEEALEKKVQFGLHQPGDNE